LVSLIIHLDPSLFFFSLFFFKLKGMTEEQKEYEAMKLVNLMDKMQRSGLISPARIGEDGRPEAVEHVLQLIEDGKSPQNEVHSDSE